MVAFASPASARDAPRTEEGQLIEWMELGSCWRVVPYAATKSEKQQDEMMKKNRKTVTKTKLKFKRPDAIFVFGGDSQVRRFAGD